MPRPGKLSAILLSACLTALGAANLIYADDAPPTTTPAGPSMDERVAQSASRQQDLKTEISQAEAQLDAVISEFDANGMGDAPDVKTLKAVRTALSRLSGKQMDQVIALLQQARAASNPDDMKKSVTQAYGAQSNVVLQLNQIMIACQNQTDLMDLSVQFGQLADRQNTALKSAKHFARQTNGNKNLDEGQTAQLQAQQDDESALRDEVQTRLDKLATLVDKVDPVTANQLSKVMDAIPPADLLASLESACVALRQTDVFQAANVELKARNQLREMARLVAPPRTSDQVLSDSADAVKNLIEQEKAVVAETTADRQIGFREEVKEKLDDLQGDVVDAIDELRKDVQPLATIPYDTLGSAQKQMQNARRLIAQSNANGALVPENASLAALADARQQLLDALAKAREAETVGETQLDQAHDVQAGIEQLRRQEEQAMAQAKAANAPKLMKAAADKQNQVTTTGQALEPDAADSSADLAQALSDALTHMDTAHDDLVKDKTPVNALPEQQAAIDALKVAQKKADDQVAKLQKEDEEEKELKLASAAVGKLITRQQQVEISTAIVSARPPGKPPENAGETPLPDDRQLADKQGSLKDDTGQVAATLPDEVSDASADLQQAQKSMGVAQTTLSKSDLPHAAGPQQKAVKHLQDAKKVIDDAMIQLAGQMDQPPDSPNQDGQGDQNEQAEEKIAAAKKAIAEAQADLQQNKDDAAAGKFQDAAQLASQAENLATDLPPDAQDGLDKAQADLKKGATDASAEKTQPAQKDAANALADLDKADGALELSDTQLAQQQQNQQNQDPSQNPNPSNMPPTTPSNGDPKKPIKPMTINTNGARGQAGGDSAFAGLPPRDRDAITQSQSERVPEDYEALYKQYMQNLAEGSKK